MSTHHIAGLVKVKPLSLEPPFDGLFRILEGNWSVPAFVMILLQCDLHIETLVVGQLGEGILLHVWELLPPAFLVIIVLVMCEMENFRIEKN